MSQSRLLSAFESFTNTLIGYVTAIATQLVVFPLFDIHIQFHQNLMIGACFTVISLIRGYIIRRFFNGLKFKVQFKVVPFADGFAVKKGMFGIWRFHRVMDPNAPVDAPAPLSVIRKFDTLEEALHFIGNNNG